MRVVLICEEGREWWRAIGACGVVGRLGSSKDEKVSINKVWIKGLTSDPSGTWD